MPHRASARLFHTLSEEPTHDAFFHSLQSKNQRARGTLLVPLGKGFRCAPIPPVAGDFALDHSPLAVGVSTKREAFFLLPANFLFLMVWTKVKLLTKALRAVLPPLQSLENAQNPTLWVKFFYTRTTPGRGMRLRATRWMKTAS